MSGETVLLGEFAHETNTFVRAPTTRRDFRARRSLESGEIVRTLRCTNTSVGGLVKVAEEEDLDLVESVAAAASPGGVVASDAYEHYAGEIVDTARDHADELDGVALSLHGAMVPEGGDDGEGPLLRRVREVVGDDIPIVATLDLHGNVTDEMVAAADALVAFRTYPHVDMGETGKRAARLLLDLIRANRDLVQAIERPPFVPFPPAQQTRDGPMSRVMEAARAVEEREGVDVVNVLPGFGKADVPSMGPSIVAVGEDDAAVAGAARAVGEEMWARREAFVVDYPDPSTAVADALAGDSDRKAPVVLADAGDNPGGGGAADGTALLRELIDREATNAGVAIMRDPEVLDAAWDAGPGARVTVDLGGKTDDHHGGPIEGLDAYVAALTDGEFVNRGPMGRGTTTRLGRTARLQCGSEDGVAVIVTGERIQPYDTEIWRHVGVQPERLDVLVVKSSTHFRADYEPLASEVVVVDSPGLTGIDCRRFDYDHRRRPLYPFEDIAGDAYPT